MEEFVDRRKGGEDANCVVVRAGEISIVKEGGALLTVTGGGVAVCIWDRKRHFAGISHFVEPAMRDPKRTTARFGNVAVFALVSMMRKHSPEGEFEAHVLGGAAPAGDNPVALANAAVARKALEAQGVPIVSEDIGGTKGRKIMFDASTGHVAVLKVHQLRSEDWGVAATGSERGRTHDGGG